MFKIIEIELNVIVKFVNIGLSKGLLKRCKIFIVIGIVKML